MIDSHKLTKWYDFQAPLYHFWRDNYEMAMIADVRDFLSQNTHCHKILDAGCGSGLFTIGLGAQRKDWRISGLDMSANLLKIGRKIAKRRNLANTSFCRGNVLALPYVDDSFDAVVAAGLFPNLNCTDPALKEFHRVLRSTGRLVIVEFDRRKMSRFTRLFMSSMILGYRAVSSCLPQFRFAEDWSIEKSTIDAEAFSADLYSANFELIECREMSDHLIFIAQKLRRE